MDNQGMISSEPTQQEPREIAQAIIREAARYGTTISGMTEQHRELLRNVIATEIAKDRAARTVPPGESTLRSAAEVEARAFFEARYEIEPVIQRHVDVLIAALDKSERRVLPPGEPDEAAVERLYEELRNMMCMPSSVHPSRIEASKDILRAALAAAAPQATLVSQVERSTAVSYQDRHSAQHNDTAPQAEKDPPDRIRGFLIERSGRSPAGQYFATSPELPGLLVAEPTQEKLEATLPCAIDMLQLAQARAENAGAERRGG